jgi:hypothetical protein
MHVTGSPGHERLMAGKNYLGMPRQDRQVKPLPLSLASRR